MTTFRQIKNKIYDIFTNSNWQNTLIELFANGNTAKSYVSPLLAFLSRPEYKWQAAWSLGVAVPIVADQSMEEARTILRRLLWSMNEESGNLGWGIPEAMGCILANQPQLAQEFSRILFSYIYETGREDNYVDHAPLRCGAYWGAGYLVLHSPQYAQVGIPKFASGLQDADKQAQTHALWALCQCTPVAIAQHYSANAQHKTAVLQSDIATLNNTLMELKSKPALSISVFDGTIVTSVQSNEMAADLLKSLACCV